MRISQRIGIIGCGNMGQAIVHGLVASGAVSPRQIWVYDVARPKARQLVQGLRLAEADDLPSLARRVRVIILCVKPQAMAVVIDELAEIVTKRHLVITIAAGLPIQFYESRLGRPIPIIRVMPNSPAMVRQGMAVLTQGTSATKRHLKLAEQIFQTVGKTACLPERFFDLVTATSGSGPAYVYRLIQAMITAGTQGGLSKPMARLLAEQTVRGAIEMAQSTRLDPEELIARVASKRGTTERALLVLQRRGFRETILEAISAATERSRELAGG